MFLACSFGAAVIFAGIRSIDKDFGTVVFYGLILTIMILRIRDIGWSGWRILLIMIPLVSLVIYFYCLFAPRDYGLREKK